MREWATETLIMGDKPVKRRELISHAREVAKHTPELAQLLVNAGGVSAIIDYLGEDPVFQKQHIRGTIRLPGIMTLGYVAAHSENLAMTVIVSKGVAQLAICLGEKRKGHTRCN